MLRDIFTNKWIIGSFGVLLIVAAGCYFWYQWELAPYKQEYAKTQQLVQEWTATPKTVTPTQEAEGVDRQDVAPAERKSVSAAPATKKTDTLLDDVDTGDNSAPTFEMAESDTAEVVQESPFGFGPYPEVPEDYPTKALVTWPAASAESELLSRVLIKLWTQGEKNFYGGSTNRGRIYPHYNNTVYTRFGEYRGANGEMVRYAQGALAGPHVKFSMSELLNPPPHLRVLDLESSGIDPYQFLDLPHQKGEK
ncbi:MAG: hypothetical protein OXU23_02540 [Candidatus Poribacteria bacterium]|nr:hypothetical protein [Candidatus Poribacteria bacterium]